MRAAAIVMPMPRDGSGFGRALETVLRERPCRVIVEADPAAGPQATARSRRSLTGMKIGATTWLCVLLAVCARTVRGRRGAPREGTGRRSRVATLGVAALQSTTPARRAGCAVPARGAVDRDPARAAGRARDRGARRADAQLPLHRAAASPGDRPLAGPRRADRAADRGGRRRAAWPRSAASARPRPRAAQLAAAAREREAKLVAEVASAILGDESIDAQLESIGNRVAVATAADPPASCFELGARPPGSATRSRCRSTRAPETPGCTLHGDAAWHQVSARARRRVPGPPARRRGRTRAGRRARRREPRPARRAEVAKTAILHAISHDLRSPLTAITTAGSAPACDADNRRRASRADRRDRRARARGWPSCRRSARPLEDRIRAPWRPRRTGATCTTSSPRPPPMPRTTIRSTSSSRLSCHWCAPTPRSSSACSRT